jgi:hypothetical protein
MKQFLVLVLFCCVGLKSFSQSGAQALRLAQSIYEQGRLHELKPLPGLQEDKIKGYSRPEQVGAYRLLTLANIYLEEPEEADKTMLKLLNADHFYEPNSSVEPAEFIGLYKTFRTRPVFNFGLKFGANSTIPLLNNVYYVSSASPGNGKYVPKIGIQVGIVFEKEFFNHAKNRTLRRVVFAPEVYYTSRTFSYTNNTIFSYDSTQTGTSKPAADQVVTAKQSWLDINPVFQLKLRESNKFIPYVGLGPGVSYLLSASNTMVTTRSGGAGVVSGPTVDYSSGLRKLVPSLLASAGVKYRFGDFYVVAEIRVQYFLITPVKPSTRSVATGVFDYMYVQSNYKPLNLTANVGFVFPYFKPIRLKRK